MTLRPLDPAGDRRWLEALWAAALGGTWPPLPAGLDLVRAGVVAEERGAAVGMVAVDPAGGIPLLLVDPAHQRRGVGTRLLDAALHQLHAAGAPTVALGSGGEDYIWPGVPDDLPAAVAFFAARGWRWDHRVIDLVRDLRDYRPPRGVYQRAARAGVSLEVAGERDLEAVLAFEAATFPIWLRWFQRQDSSMLVARDRDGRVAGTLLFRGPDEGLLFAPMLGPASGTIACVGVADHLQGHGVGSAMVARASELLRRAGTGACHIGWVVRRDFYVRVGYTPWRTYLMARRQLPSTRAG